MSATFVAAAALATAALVKLDHVGDTGVGAVNGESAVEGDLDAFDDDEWDLFEPTAVAGPNDALSRTTPASAF